MHDAGLRRRGDDVTTAASPADARDAEPPASAVPRLLRRLFAQAHDSAAAAVLLSSGTVSHSSSEPGTEKSSGRDTAEQRVRRHRLKVAVVGESESGRTSLCASLDAAAERTTAHPLIMSGAAASLKLDASIMSVQTYDLRTETECAALEVTITDSGPAPLTSGAGLWAVAEADVVLLCFPLYSVKQVVETRRAEDGAGFGGVVGGLFGAAPKPTEAFIHARECQLLCTLLGAIASRCCRVSTATPFAAPPAVLLVGTFQDTLRDASVAATHTILAALRRLCARAAQESPGLPRVHDVVAVSTTEDTCVLLRSQQQLSLAAWWPRMLNGVATSARAVSPPAPLPASDDAVRHLLGHHNPLTALHGGVRHVGGGGRASPRLFRVTEAVDAAAVPVSSEVATRETRAEDARVASLVVDFVTELKARKRTWLLPLPRLWRVAYALGMQAREQLYLTLRQMEATGEVVLLGRALAYAHERAVSAFPGTNETVCLCPALLRASLAVVYVYSDWAARRQRRHIRKCLRGVDMQECETADKGGLAAKGQFRAALLHQLATALALKGASPAEAADVLAATLIGADLAYLTVPAELPTSCAQCSEGDSAADTSTASASVPAQHPLQPPSPGSRGATSTPASSATSPIRGSAHGASTATADELLSLSVSSPALDDADGRDNAGTVRSATVAQLTSLFLLGEFTPAPDASPAALSRSTGPFHDPVRDPLHSPHYVARGDDRTPTGTARDVVLVVPALQVRLPCPTLLVQQVERQASIAATAVAGEVSSTQLGLELDPFPADFVASLLCRFASVGMHVERAYHDALLLSGDTRHLFRGADARVRTSTGASSATAPLAAAAASRSRRGVERNVCLFVHCAPTAGGAPTRAAELLRLFVFADSTTQAHFVERATCTELRRLLLQRTPGVALSPPASAASEVEPETAPLAPHPACRRVEDLLRTLLRDQT